MEKISFNVLNLHPHNVVSYKKIKKSFSDGERFVAIVHATGTGKNYNFLQLLLDNPNKKFVFVTPYNSIIEHVKTIMFELKKENSELDLDNVQFYTYNAIASMSDEELENLELDYLVLDEFHHIGAPKWGESVNKIIDFHEDVKVLGMSAYTIRDRGTIYERDMVELGSNEVFAGKVVSRYDLVDAMTDGVLPVPIYRSTHINLEDLIKKIEKKVNCNNLRGEEYDDIITKLDDAKKKVSKKNETKELFLKNIKSNGKYIYFCPVNSTLNVNDIDTLMKEVTEWLIEAGYKSSDFVLYKTTSKNKESGVLNRNAFYNDRYINGDDAANKLRIMFAINQYNEGIHAPNVDGVILGRETQSDIVFFEQIGRALSVRGDSKLGSPVIIDFADNIEYIIQLENSFKGRKVKYLEKYERNIVDSSNIEDVNFDIDIVYHDLYNELIKLKERFDIYTWEDSYSLACKFYNKYGHLGIARNFRTDDGVNYDLYGYRLGDWIAEMRRSKNILSQDKVKKLENIGMVWKCYYSWNESYDKLCLFVKKFGINSVKVNSVYLGVKIGEWLNNQKALYRKGMLSEEHTNKLEKLGVVWNVIKTWEDSYKLLIKFYKKYNHINLPYMFKTNDGINYVENGYCLYDWLRNQKVTFKNGKLSKDRINKLLVLGFDFEIKVIKKSLSLDDYKIVLSKFYEDTGSILATRGELHKIDGYDDPIDIARIIDRIKRKKDDGVLSLDDIKFFEKLGIKWTSYVPKSWDEAYSYAVLFFEEYGHLNVSSTYKTNDGFDLGNWIYLQRKNVDKLSKDRIDKLNQIDMIWDVKLDRKKVLDIVEVSGIDYKKNKVVIDAISLFEIKAKLRYLTKHGLTVCSEEGLHEIFSVSNEELVNLIGIDYRTLLIKYLPRKDKEVYVKSLQK
ncbi:MAG: Helicase associated domain protein [Bacilli bacterium]|nr:Helicase associated domain protein [Bacilli bacterium]